MFLAVVSSLSKGRGRSRRAERRIDHENGGDISEKDNAFLTGVVLEISTVAEEPGSLNEFE